LCHAIVDAIMRNIAFRLARTIDFPQELHSSGEELLCIQKVLLKYPHILIPSTLPQKITGEISN
jgi:hypothetical protein